MALVARSSMDSIAMCQSTLHPSTVPNKYDGSHINSTLSFRTCMGNMIKEFTVTITTVNHVFLAGWNFSEITISDILA